MNEVAAELGSVVLDLGAGVNSLTDDNIYYRRLQPSDVDQCKVSSGRISYSRGVQLQSLCESRGTRQHLQ